MDKNYSIYEATEKDLPGIAECLKEFNPDLNLDTLISSFQDREHTGNTFTFVAKHLNDGFILGTASVIIDYKLFHDGKPAAFIEDVAVHRDYQKLKIGSVLVNHCVEFAKKLNCYKAILSCDEGLIEYYKKFKFIHDGFMMRLNF